METLMFRHLWFLLSLATLMLDADPAPDPDPKPDPESKPDTKPKVTFTDDQQAEISRIVARETRKAADKARKDRDDELDEEKRQADAKAEQDRQTAAGEFDKVRQSLEGERDTIKGERDALKAEHDALTAYFAAQYDAAVKDLPDVIKAFAPDDDASVTAKAAWLTKAQEQAKKLGTQSQRGNGPNPPPAGPQKPNVRESLKGIRYT